MKKFFFGLAMFLCLFAVSNARAYHVLDTGHSSERVCNPKSYTDLGNGIVSDNVTGLEWVKDGNLMASRNSDFDHEGTWGDGLVTWQRARDYIDLLNTEEFLGYHDWRLPNIEELSTLVHAGRHDPAIDPLFSAASSAYWSLTTYEGATENAWFVHFAVGRVDFLRKNDNNHYVRAVRGAPFGTSYGPSYFVTNGDGTVTDRYTGLVWQQCAYGQTWTGTECTGGAGTRTWTQAVAYVQGLNTARYLGFDDWRLPTRNELQGLLDYGRWNPPTQFPGMTQDYYWSSTVCAGNSGMAMGVGFQYGQVGNGLKGYGYCVRAVRGGPCLDTTPECASADDCDSGELCAEGMCLVPVKDTGGSNERECNPASYTDLGNGTVLDNVTGLEWVQNGNLMASRDPDFDTDAMVGDGKVTWQHASDYVDLLNTEECLGHSDWRLPAIDELVTLVDAGRRNPAIDPVFSAAGAAYTSQYWSSTNYADNTDYVWYVNFDEGVLQNNLEKSSDFYLRPVRGGPYQPLNNFIINGNGTVTSHSTGLMWDQCINGQTWGGTECTGTTDSITWSQAVAYIQGLNDSEYLGYRDWRLPTKNELQSLIDYNRYDPATAFPELIVTSYWSSTDCIQQPWNAWFIYFGDGNGGGNGKSGFGYARAVRGGPCRADGDWCIDETDCPDGSACVEGACVVADQPPEFLSEPLWVGPWMGLSSDPANPHKPQSKDILFWAYDDDRLACSGGVELSWMYRPVALQEGVVVGLGDWVVKEPWRYLWFAWIETPGIADIAGPGLFEFKMTATDCLDQEIDSEGFWGKRYYFQVD